MSPTIFGCPFCGYKIHDEGVEPSWLGEFRAIYSDSLGIRISGIGRYEDSGAGIFVVPSDPTSRWDNNESTTFIEIPVMRQPSYNSRHGFIFHDACWHLLKRACQPREVPLSRLFDVFRSLPSPLRGHTLCWGHDYGGLLSLDDESHYPWEDRLLGGVDDVEVLSSAKQNPYDIPELSEFLKTPSEHLPQFHHKPRSKDIFSSVPWEILEKIAKELPTKEALSLRLVSAAFLPLRDSNTFWASRFRPYRERGFLFETRDKREHLNWMNLYKATNGKHIPSRLRNRKRIWTIFLQTAALINLCPTHVLGDGNEQQYTGWRRVGGFIKDESSVTYPRGFYEGCRVLSSHIAKVPQKLFNIGISICSVGDVEYVSGLRLEDEEGSSTFFGYLSQSREVICNATGLKGFILANGSRGINALRVVRMDGTLSEWYGCAKNSPITEYLATFQSVAALEAKFDGFKIVSIGVLGDISPEVHVPYEFRQAALWYPNVPGNELCLNEVSFTGLHPIQTNYQPLFWIHFGGPKRHFLRNVSGISINYFKRLNSIEVHHTLPSVPGQYRLGRYDSSKIPTTNVKHFTIDGNGGELIQTLEVRVKRDQGPNSYGFLKNGIVSSIKITTNWNRAFQVGVSSDEDTLEPLKIAPGTTLTGLYASQHRKFGLISLGVISE